MAQNPPFLDILHDIGRHFYFFLKDDIRRVVLAKHLPGWIDPSKGWCVVHFALGLKLLDDAPLHVLTAQDCPNDSPKLP